MTKINLIKDKSVICSIMWQYHLISMKNDEGKNNERITRRYDNIVNRIKGLRKIQ